MVIYVYRPIATHIGLDVLSLDALKLVTSLHWEVLPFLGKLKSNLWFPSPRRRLSIEPWLPLLVRSYGYAGSYMI